MLPFSKPASEVISEYSRKVDFLKGMLQAEKLVSLSSYPSALIQAPVATGPGHSPPVIYLLLPMFPQTSSSEKALANQFLAPGRVPTTARERVPATKTVHLQSRARYTSEMRSELLGMVGSPLLPLGPSLGPQQSSLYRDRD